ncbi:hypothetical protein LXL04_031523 [Taraxacum kok-saghyz]
MDEDDHEEKQYLYDFLRWYQDDREHETRHGILYFKIECVIFDYCKFVLFNGILQLIIYTKEKNAILFTCPLAVSFVFLFQLQLKLFLLASILIRNRSDYKSTRLMISSKLPRFSDLYTLTIASADPKMVCLSIIYLMQVCTITDLPSLSF